MKSKIRSRWHRPNEKPLEKSAAPPPALTMGEIDPTSLTTLTDDLSNFTPTEKASSNTEISEDHKGPPKGRRRHRDNRRSRSNNNGKEDSSEGKDRSSISRDSLKEGHSKDKKYKRSRGNNRGKKDSNKNGKSSRHSKPQHKKSSKKPDQATGLKGFLGRLFG